MKETKEKKESKELPHNIETVKKAIETTVEYDNRDDRGHMYHWYYLEGFDKSNDWLSEFVGKKVKVTVEVIEK